PVARGETRRHGREAGLGHAEVPSSVAQRPGEPQGTLGVCGRGLGGGARSGAHARWLRPGPGPGIRNRASRPRDGGGGVRGRRRRSRRYARDGGGSGARVARLVRDRRSAVTLYPPCAASSATSAATRPFRSFSRDFGASSTEATTQPAWPWSTTASRWSSEPGSSTNLSGRWRSTDRPAAWGWATPGG